MKHFVSYLRDVATINLNVDGSISPVSYIATPPAGEVFLIMQISLIFDTSGLFWGSNTFADIAALANGLQVRIMKDTATVEKDLLDGEPIKDNFDLFKWSYRDNFFANSGTADRAAYTRRYSESDGGPLRIRDLENERIEVTVEDDLTLAFTRLHVIVQGYQHEEGKRGIPERVNLQ